MSPPLVSVLIPCYNNANTIGESIESALNQTYQNIEVVVVDDGSVDESRKKIEAYAGRIQVLSIPNSGACAARNKAFQLSSGAYVQYLDGDDRLLPAKIEMQIENLLQRQLAWGFCRGNLFGDGKPERPKKSPIPDPTGIDPFLYCLRNGLATEGPLIRRDLIESVNGFREHVRRGQERDLHLRIAACGWELGFVPEYLYAHRNHDDPNRITRTPIREDYLLTLDLELADLFSSGSPYQLTEPRAQAFAEHLVKISIYAFRNGYHETAKQGFDRATRLIGKTPPYQERWLHRAIAKLVGVYRTEQFLYQLKKLLRREIKVPRN